MQNLKKKLTCGWENDMRNLAHFCQSTRKSKLGLKWDPFMKSRKYMNLKFTEELYVVTMKDDAKFEE